MSHEIKGAVEAAEKKTADLLSKHRVVKYVGERNEASIESAVEELLFLVCAACFPPWFEML